MKWLFFFLLFSLGASAQFESSQKKSEYSWTLEEWLDQKERIKFMDLWLMLHSSSPYEFFVGYNQGSSSVEQSGVKTLGRISEFDLGAYATIVGIEASFAENQDKDKQWIGTLNFRLMGPSVQSTNWTIYGGVWNSSPEGSDERRHNTAGTKFTIFWLKHFGTTFDYKAFLPRDSNSQRYEGQELLGSMYIDFDFFRVLGKYQETQFTETVSGTKTKLTSLRLGIQLFF